MEEYIGIAEDPRSLQDRLKDYQYDDLVMGEIKLNWIDYEDKTCVSYIIQNQDGSLSCVAQATAKLLAIHECVEGREYKQLCPKFIYTRRENYPNGGMWLPNALSIACKYGSCPELFMPCDNKGETFMNDKTELPMCAEKALPYRAKYYFEIPVEIDKIAEVLEQGYGVLLGMEFDYDEWTDVPKINPKSKNKCRHGIAAVDYCLYKGQKALIIEDSWGPTTGKGGRRIITEDFLMEKCFYAGYITSLPNYTFTKTLRLGSTGIDVRKLQEKLNECGYILKVDGIFGRMTQEAVISYQKKHQLVPDGICGKFTNSALNNV